MMKCKNLFLVLSIFLTCSSVLAQNVGIGENNPGSKLSVKGNLSVGTNYANATAPLNGIIVEGNVGIGTSVPNASALLEMNAADKGLLVPRIPLMATNNASPITTPANALLVFNTVTAGVGVTAVFPGFYYWDGTQWIRLITSDTDAQTLFFNVQTGDLSISNGNTINIPQVTDTDDQTLALDTNTHVLSIDNGNNVNLNPYLDNTDAQTLGYNGITGVLDISGGNSVIIPIVIDTDAQTLSYDTLTGDVSISGGNTINIPQVSDTDDQTLALDTSTHVLSIDNGNNVDLTPYLDNTDAQNLSYNVQTGDLSIDNGNTVNLTGLNANDWHITGNAGTNSLTHFLGTSDNEPLRFRTNNILSGEINPNGNTFLGYQAGMVNTGINNVFVGGNAGQTNTLGINNIALGKNALSNNETGNRNIAIGTSALATQSFNNAGANWTSNNIAIGYQALFANEPTSTTEGNNNIAIGAMALNANVIGTRNIAIGTDAGGSITTGDANVALGRDALRSITTTIQNTAIGTEALKLNTTGANNTAVGHQAMANGTTGNNNTVVGMNALYNVNGNNNTILGREAGFTTLGSGNVFLGFRAGYDELGSNKLYIDNSNTATPLIYGNFANNRLAIGGNSPAHKLHINGGPLWTSDSWAGSLELNNTAAIGWNTNGTYSYGMGSSTNGLYIWHTTSTPATTTSAATYRMILHNNGYTAIGANLGAAYVPSAPLHVDGFSNSGLGNFAYYAYSAGIATGVANGTTDVSIYATNRVRASEFNAFSDARIKDIVSVSEKENDLATLMHLTVTNYRHKDVVSKGNDLKKGFIAQDVENIFVEAVTKSTDFIPNIYAAATNIIHKNGNLVISLPNPSDLQVGEKVRLIADTYKQDAKITAIVDATTFICEDFAGSGDKIFVYGKEVSDFRAVDYDRIFTLNVSATQALAEKVAKLQQENEKLKALNESYEVRFQRIEAKISNNIR